MNESRVNRSILIVRGGGGGSSERASDIGGEINRLFITYIICKMLHIEFYGFIFDFYRSTLQNYSPATHRTGESNLFLVHFILILLILCIYNSYFKDGSALANQICDVQSGKIFVQCARISQVHCVLVKFSHDQLC